MPDGMAVQHRAVAIGNPDLADGPAGRGADLVQHEGERVIQRLGLADAEHDRLQQARLRLRTRAGADLALDRDEPDEPPRIVTVRRDRLLDRQQPSVLRPVHHLAVDPLAAEQCAPHVAVERRRLASTLQDTGRDLADHIRRVVAVECGESLVDVRDRAAEVGDEDDVTRRVDGVGEFPQRLLRAAPGRDVDPDAHEVRLALQHQPLSGQEERRADPILRGEVCFRARRAEGEDRADPLTDQLLLVAREEVGRVQQGELRPAVAAHVLESRVPANEASRGVDEVVDARQALDRRIGQDPLMCVDPRGPPPFPRHFQSIQGMGDVVGEEIEEAERSGALDEGGVRGSHGQDTDHVAPTAEGDDGDRAHDRPHGGALDRLASRQQAHLVGRVGRHDRASAGYRPRHGVMSMRRDAERCGRELTEGLAVRRNGGDGPRRLAQQADPRHGESALLHRPAADPGPECIARLDPCDAPVHLAQHRVKARQGAEACHRLTVAGTTRIGHGSSVEGAYAPRHDMPGGAASPALTSAARSWRADRIGRRSRACRAARPARA